jgi:hypothetical protein
MTDEPRRLLHDPDAPGSVRDDLRRVEQLAPAPFDVSAGLARLRTELHPGAAASGTGHVTWWAGGTLAVIVTAAAVLWPRPPESPHIAVPKRAVSAPAVTPAENAPPRDEAAPLTDAGPPAPRHPARAASDPDARLRRELAHLAKLRSTAERDPAAALRLADQGQRAFKGGMFEEEREAIAVFSLGALGRDAAARARARTFLARYPRGPFATRVRAIADDVEGAGPDSTSRRGGSP